VSCLKESDNNTGAHDVTPYTDPRFFENQSYRITEESDIYSLGVLFWELTSRKTPFKYKTGDDCALRLRILSGLREEPIPNTNVIFVELYQSKYKIGYNTLPQHFFHNLFLPFY
jgi:serine/threonine protein kinase